MLDRSHRRWRNRRGFPCNLAHEPALAPRAAVRDGIPEMEMYLFSFRFPLFPNALLMSSPALRRSAQFIGKCFKICRLRLDQPELVQHIAKIREQPLRPCARGCFDVAAQ